MREISIHTAQLIVGHSRRLFIKIGSVIVSAARQIFLLTLSAIILFPVYVMIVSSLKTKNDYLQNPLGLPSFLTFQNFTQLLHFPEFGRWMLNSGILTIGSVLLAILFSVPMAFAFHRMIFPGRRLLLGIVVALLVVPSIVLILPLFELWVKVGLINTYLGAILIYSGTLVPFIAYIIYSFFETIPSALAEAAIIDGCRNDQLLTKIYMPLAKPAIITGIVVSTIWIWNELLIAVVFLQKDQLKSLMVGLTVFRDQYMINIPVTMAGMVLACLPIAILYFWGQRQLMEGMLTGAIK